MKNPFPGMNPYLEARWGDVHTRLCAYVSAALQPNLPAGLRARAQEVVYLETLSGQRIQRFEADGVVIRSDGFDRKARRGASGNGAGVATIEPVLIRHPPTVMRQRSVEIVDTTSGNRVVTAIEILSPGNKSAGRLNKLYLGKIDRYQEAGVNIVEIDLLRSSRRRLPVKTEELPPDRRTPYLVCVQRGISEDYAEDDNAGDDYTWEVYPLPLREPLARIPIPCRKTDPDVALALQPLIDQTYVDGGHDDIDYTVPPSPPLDADDQAWATKILAPDARV